MGGNSDIHSSSCMLVTLCTVEPCKHGTTGGYEQVPTIGTYKELLRIYHVLEDC